MGSGKNVTLLTIILLLCLFFSTLAFAIEDTFVGGETSAADATGAATPIAWLKAHQYSSGLVESQIGWPDHRSFTYDQAGAAIAFTASGNLSNARRVLSAMASVQNTDGSWYDAYYSDTKAPWEWSKSSGNTTWMVLAINFYEKRTGDKQYAAYAMKALSWVKKRIETDTSSNCFGAVSLGQNFYNIPHPENIFSTEHNLDAYSAFKTRAALTTNLTRRADYKAVAAKIKTFLTTEVWNGSAFYRGCNDNELWLDTQPWGYMVLGSAYSAGLAFAEANMVNTIPWKGVNVTGFQYNNYDTASVWVEGTGQMAAAYGLIGDTNSASFYLNELKKTIRTDGGMPYSFNAIGGAIAWPDNLRYSSASSVFWYYFAKNKVNPFKP